MYTQNYRTVPKNRSKSLAMIALILIPNQLQFWQRPYNEFKASMKKSAGYDYIASKKLYISILSKIGSPLLHNFPYVRGLFDKYPC